MHLCNNCFRCYGYLGYFFLNLGKGSFRRDFSGRLNHSKNKTPYRGIMLYLFGCETKTGVVCVLVIFQDRPMFSHIIKKVLARAFHWCGWIGLCIKLPNYALPLLDSYPKQVLHSSKRGICFYSDHCIRQTDRLDIEATYIWNSSPSWRERNL